MPSIDYVAVIWASLHQPNIVEGKLETRTYQIPLSNDEHREVLACNMAVLDRIMKEKIQPIYMMSASPMWTCIACQRRPATRMINTISLHRDAPGGPTAMDHTPFPICESADCNFNATRHAHEYRRECSEQNPSAAQAELEMCDNCKTKQRVSDAGRMKRCSRCKARLYCSKKCQIEDWKKHKLHCKSFEG